MLMYINNNEWPHNRNNIATKDLLRAIVVTAPVFHFEMSELKADGARNTTQTNEQGKQKWENSRG